MRKREREIERERGGGGKRGGGYKECKLGIRIMRYGVYEGRVRALQMYVLNLLFMNYRKRQKF